MDSETLFWILASGSATAIGALGLLVLPRPRGSRLDGLLGFTAGIMLAASVFSLLVPAFERGSTWQVLAGFALGAATLTMLDAFVPHAHARLRERGGPTIGESEEGQRAFLLLSAMTIHNAPEGLAVGVAFAAGGTELGIPIAVAIGIQNIPEGFAAASPLIATGMRRRKAAAIGALTGVVEPPAALLAFAAFELASGLLVYGLAFAAGAMIYVVVDELIPESHSNGNERIASLWLLVGFALMMTLDNALG